ncbi:MAG: recombination protein RecR [Myxococcales bacterium]|nr:recombination protein RecR [Myxococcales bacterium]
MDRLVGELSKLPGVGEKTARRFAFFILNAPETFARDLSEAVRVLRSKTTQCSQCCNITESNPCQLCSSERRNGETICVVEQPADLLAIEKTGEFNGRYHVLHGVINPLDGIGPDDVRIKELVSRLGSGEVQEVIVATNPTVNGEATAAYIQRLLKPIGVSVSRIALGIPMGSDIEFADRVTLGRALTGRQLL